MGRAAVGHPARALRRVFLDALDVSMVGVALPSIRRRPRTSTTGRCNGSVSGYILGYGGLLLLGGRAADLLGRRRVFLVGARASSSLASLLGGLVDRGTLLIASRFIKGLSAAFTAPAGLSIITTTFAEGPARNRALTIYTTCGASGFSLGLVLGGLLTELGWRWTFLLPAPDRADRPGRRPALHAARHAPARRTRGYDIPGAVTVTRGDAAAGVHRRRRRRRPAGRRPARSALPRRRGAARRVRRHRAALATRWSGSGILRSARLVRANLGAMALLGSYIGFQFLVTLYMQSLLGWSPLHTALAFLPAGALVALGVDAGRRRSSTASARRG